MDDVDRATDEAEAYLAERIRQQARAIALPYGLCLFCEADLDGRRTRFCDAYCAADWQHEQEVLRRQGGM